MIRALIGGVVAAGVLAVASVSSHAQDSRPVLNLDTAQQMASACLALAKTEGWPMHVAIVDNHGNLKLYARMDGTSLLPQKIAIMKAETSASFPVSTKQIAGFGFPEGVAGPFSTVPGVIFFEGGIPIMGAGGHIGGIGVSGSSAENDGKCAQAGIDAVASLLK